MNNQLFSITCKYPIHFYILNFIFLKLKYVKLTIYLIIWLHNVVTIWEIKFAAFIILSFSLSSFIKWEKWWSTLSGWYLFKAICFAFVHDFISLSACPWSNIASFTMNSFQKYKNVL